MRQYLEQWFDSPVWSWGDEGVTELEEVRRRVHAIATDEDIRAVLRDALELGIDPL